MTLKMNKIQENVQYPVEVSEIVPPIARLLIRRIPQLMPVIQEQRIS